ncbi:type II toxin-antitoxin system RelE family toxin [Coleofasciculus sp.]|uniref:type II toxin-antitoxin system RelE family toxin n=1 Tax=Coleofasciculus sp. TaxID=3100458 RepID=UPI0039F88B91
MKSSITKAFRKQLGQLPESLREQARKAYALWRSDPYHNSLQFKRVSQRQPIYSARIGLNYRVLGLLEKDHIYWFWIGSHAEYDELLQRL